MNDKKVVIARGNFNDQKNTQKFNNQQIYTKGFSYQSQANTINTESINLGGKARFLHGIAYYSPQANQTDEDILSLTINSEVVIENVIAWNYCPQSFNGNIFKEGQFYKLPRPLSGSDSVELSNKTVNGHNYYLVFFLSDVAP